MTKLKNEIGNRFGAFVVIERAPNKIRGKQSFTAWICRCDCGNIKTISANDLRSGVQSCGCLARKQTSERSTTHGQTATPTYRSWLHAKMRCYQPSWHAYADYGGRGITMCERWKNSFEAFLADMGERPPKTTLERIDTNGNYDPGNCRWATRKEQARNRRSNVLVDTPFGRVTLAEAIERSGLPASMVHSRAKRGWPIKDWFMPRQKPGPKIS